MINELGKKNIVTLYWVPEHMGIKRNEQADELARKGTSSPFIELFCGIGANTIFYLASTVRNKKKRGLA